MTAGVTMAYTGVSIAAMNISMPSTMALLWPVPLGVRLRRLAAAERRCGLQM
jgi:hypothetical protein